MKKLLLIITMITIASCGGNSNNNAKPVSKIDAFIETMSKDSQVFSAKVFRNPEDGKTGKFLVLSVLFQNDHLTKYYKRNMVFDISIYEQGESWGSYIAKYKEKYIFDVDEGTNPNKLNIPTVYEVKSEDLSYLEEYYQGDLKVEVGDYYFETYQNEVIYILEETESTSKDLEKIGALQEVYEKNRLLEKLSTDFGLSEERSIKVSNMIFSWKKISKKRSMTKKDADLFSQEILGTDMKTAESAYKKMIHGSPSNYESLIDIAAEENDISPEHMTELINELLN